MSSPPIDLDRLFRLRVLVARVGEMDLARWWNTTGQLGPVGARALRRGFPRTHHFAQARSVVAVAAQRCAEVFDPPGSVTLFRLPAETEEELEARWERWIDAPEEWAPFFEAVAARATSDLPATLRAFDLVTDADVAAARRLRPAPLGKSVQLPALYGGRDEDLTMLALAFSCGSPGELAVPYARLDG